MEAVSQFGWAEVAGIAGTALVCLMALLGVLLGILLRRQSNSSGDCLKQMKDIQKSVVDKLDGEVADRKAEIAEIKKIVEQGRSERRYDINVLHKKLEAGLVKVVSDFKEMCGYRQEQCSTLQKAQLNGVSSSVIITCKKIEKVEKEQSVKWERQDKFNISLMSKEKNVNI